MIRDGMEQLLLGTLQLARGSGVSDGDAPYELYALADDATFGSPAPVTTIIDSLLGDGQLVSIDRHGNREAKFGIRIKGQHGLALNQAEAALVAETEKANTLTWVGPDAYTPATVFDVVTSWVEHVLDSDDEINTSRKYILNLSLYPHPRSSQSTTVEAMGSGIDPVVAPTYTTINACNALTGWTGRPTIAGTVDAITMGSTGSYLYQRADNKYDLWLTYDTGSVHDWTATPYISVDWKSGSFNDTSRPLSCFISGPSLAEVGITKVSEGPSPLGSGFTRSVFLIPPAYQTLVRKVKFFKGNDLTTDGRWTFQITEFGVTDGGAANDGTSRQLSRSLDIRGSARAMGLIDIRHENPLGDVLVWSGPAVCSPPLRKVRVSGAGQLADTDAVSGAYEDIGSTPFTADVPLDTLPSGAYLVMARLATTSTAGSYTVDVTAQTRVATSDTTTVPVGPVLTINDAAVTLSPDPTRKIVMLGVLHLPAAEVAPGSTGVLRVTLQGANVRLDEAWLYNITDGSLTWVAGAENVLQLTSPTVSDARRRVWTGPSASALYDGGSKTNYRGHHRFNPGEWVAHTVTTDVQDAAVSVTYDKRWHSNAGEDG